MRMKARGFWIAEAGLFALLASGSVRGADYYVATNGSDSGPGTLAQPFASIRP